MATRVLTDTDTITWDEATANQVKGNAQETGMRTLLGLPAVTVDNTVPRFNGTGGGMQTSGVTVDDSNNVAGVVNLSQTGYTDLTEVSEPSGPAANVARVFAFDVQGSTHLRAKTSNGNVLHLLQIGNVKNYGALGDGVTDDTAAIEAAISAQSGNTHLYFPAGKYVLGSGGTLTFADKNVTICGDGKHTSEILCTHADAKFVFTDSANSSQVSTAKRLTVRGITITKAVATTANSGGTCIDAAWSYTGIVSDVDHAEFVDMRIQGEAGKCWNEGIRLTDAGGVFWTDVDISQSNDPSTDAYAAVVLERSASSNMTRYYAKGIFFFGYENGFALEQAAASQNGTIEGLYITNAEIVGCRYAVYDDNDDANNSVNVITYTGSHCGVSRGFISGYRVANLHVFGCQMTISAIADSAGGGGGAPVFDFAQALLHCSIFGNRIIRSLTNTTTANCIEITDQSVGIKLWGNTFEHWTAPIALKSGTLARTMVAAWIGPNILSSSGSYPGIGIIQDWENGPFKITQNYAANLMQFQGPGSGHTFNARIRPESNDGGALGAPTISWSDLFLADGGVINWNNGNYTLTHSSGQLTANGGFKSSSASAGIGYATGAGGAVTQATDKSTGVTLNTICGQITLATGSVAAGGVATFQLTNSAIASTDVVAVCVDSGGTANAYSAHVVSVSAGSCNIQLRNVTGGALNESGILLNFAVIKAVAA